MATAATAATAEPKRKPEQDTPFTVPAPKTAAEPAALPPSVAPSPVAPPAVAKASRNRWPLVLSVLAATALVAWCNSRPTEQQLTCRRQLAEAVQHQVDGDGPGARSQSLLASVSCTGPDQVKAAEIQATADRMIAAQARCDRTFRRVSAQLAESRLQSAGASFEQLDAQCTDSAAGQTLRMQIDAARTQARETEATVRQQLAAGDLKAARAALEQLALQDREYPELLGLRQAMQSAVSTQEAAEAASAAEAARAAAVLSANAPAPVPARPPEADLSALRRPPVVVAPAAAATANPQAELARQFLRDAESALQQMQFDKAKTLVESAERLDPSNAQAGSLARRIRDRELDYARKEMIIR